ncbi:hypothetical protein CYLTODRAFT_417676 [Cylindrobasidium torrendii FP15055 ss-10]|uniref:Uncharacterized protein n=1 Tax=Cylindrobasidium torrendii FP15055 ss-10 TaxID=1314674 RepID=A0A0D7BQE5_9AGAR|nr:hypothetical protein CYLTODRAFT_417676 [Cylindrobasidium torrendii FP15055 ss-10]
MATATTAREWLAPPRLSRQPRVSQASRASSPNRESGYSSTTAPRKRLWIFRARTMSKYTRPRPRTRNYIASIRQTDPRLHHSDTSNSIPTSFYGHRQLKRGTSPCIFCKLRTMLRAASPEVVYRARWRASQGVAIFGVAWKLGFCICPPRLYHLFPQFPRALGRVFTYHLPAIEFVVPHNRHHSSFLSLMLYR